MSLLSFFRRPKDDPLTGWKSAFDDSRARGHNTDAYTFQIAWAYARDYFERRTPAREGEQKVGSSQSSNA